jgi:hypothetical protein
MMPSDCTGVQRCVVRREEGGWEGDRIGCFRNAQMSSVGGTGPRPAGKGRYLEWRVQDLALAVWRYGRMWIESRGESRAMVVQGTKKSPWIGKRGCQACRGLSAAAAVVAHAVVAVVAVVFPGVRVRVTPLSKLGLTNWPGL